MLNMVVTDLDGTLANQNGEISEADLATLKHLGETGIMRVIATGRSLYSVKKSIDANLPLDFLLFSCGAGILDWKKKKIIKNNALRFDEIEHTNSYLFDLNVDFMLHLPIPDNHHFFYHSAGNSNPDFEKRIQLYRKFSRKIKKEKINITSACQYVVIPGEGSVSYEKIVNDLTNLSVIRTTSPLDKQTPWLEIFPACVSKGQSAAWLCNRLGIKQSSVLSIGNDYNDLDLLEWSGYSYAVGNAAVVLKQKFNLTKSNHESAFMHAVHDVLQI